MGPGAGSDTRAIQLQDYFNSHCQGGGQRYQQLGVPCGQNQYCPHGSTCSRNGRMCVAEGVSDCGTHLCARGSKCVRGGRCIPDGAVACGNGYCGDGSRCTRDQKCLNPEPYKNNVARLAWNLLNGTQQTAWGEAADLSQDKSLSAALADNPVPNNTWTPLNNFKVTDVPQSGKTVLSGAVDPFGSREFNVRNPPVGSTTQTPAQQPAAQRPAPTSNSAGTSSAGTGQMTTFGEISTIQAPAQQKPANTTLAPGSVAAPYFGVTSTFGETK
jgi:hypothetical protein